MIEIFLLFCFIAVLSALVSILRVIRLIANLVARALWTRIRRPTAQIGD